MLKITFLLQFFLTKSKKNESVTEEWMKKVNKNDEIMDGKNAR